MKTEDKETKTEETTKTLQERFEDFREDLQAALEEGSPNLSILVCMVPVKNASCVPRREVGYVMPIADVLADEEFLQNVWKKYGAGDYIFTVWREDTLTVFGEHEFKLPLNQLLLEDEDDEEPDDPRWGQIDIDGFLMLRCIEVADGIMKETKILAPAVGQDYERFEIARCEMQARMALDIYRTVTKVVPAQAQIFAKGLDYLGLLMDEKAADVKRSEELKASMPTFPPFIASVPACEHPGLKALWVALTSIGTRDVGEDHIADWGQGVIDAMSFRPTLDDEYFLLCSHCRAIVPLDKFMSGELWDDKE